MKDDTRHRLRQRKGPPPPGRIRPSIRVFLEDCLRGIIVDMTEGRENEFVPIRILDVQKRFRDGHFLKLNERQVQYLFKRLLHLGFIEREIHNRDRTATSWKGQITRYRMIER